MRRRGGWCRRPRSASRSSPRSSPRALIDVLFVFVASLRLIRQLARLYGGRPGALGMIRLLRHVIAHLAITGGMAASDSLVQQMLGHGIAAKLSQRLGEGVLNGLLTARLGPRRDRRDAAAAVRGAAAAEAVGSRDGSAAEERGRGMSCSRLPCEDGASPRAARSARNSDDDSPTAAWRDPASGASRYRLPRGEGKASLGKHRRSNSPASTRHWNSGESGGGDEFRRPAGQLLQRVGIHQDAAPACVRPAPSGSRIAPGSHPRADERSSGSRPT